VHVTSLRKYKDKYLKYMKYCLYVCLCVVHLLVLKIKKKNLFFGGGGNSLTGRVFVTQMSGNAEMTA